MSTFSIGIDYGTESGRVLVIDLKGKIVGTSIIPYKHGVITSKLPVPDAPNLPQDYALQHPNDYMEVLRQGIPNALRDANITKKSVIGIGVTFTSSTVLATDNYFTPLCLQTKYESNPHAWVKLWKHHGAQAESKDIYTLAADRREEWLRSYGNHVSAEWFIPKCLETFRKAPDVFYDTDLFIEAGDWIVSMLTGKIVRSNCSLGFKAFWNEESGVPKDFLTAIQPEFATHFCAKLKGDIKKVGEKAGALTTKMADELGLSAGTPVAVSIIDAHSGLLGIGASDKNQLTMVMGTSTCHLMLNDQHHNVPGISGVVKDAIIPGLYAYEAGQSAVGDLFGWYTRQIPVEYETEANNKKISIFQLLEEKAKVLAPHESGLLALDWYNGNRSILSNFDLSGIIVGMTMETTAEEIYRSLLEASAFGAKIICDTYEKEGLIIEKINACGGLPQNNELLMQIYADILNKEIHVSATNHASGVGAAILGATAGGAFQTVKKAVQKMKQPTHKTYFPIKENVKIYRKLFEVYRQVHDYFGVEHPEIMKKLKYRSTN
ncbi:ribulokinase [Virgibacillus sp. W0181]|uniref:ribulokinase n=1 Tax=Virgibacillus sp. W0181 TaxID=3391581 RepID=UPI003F44E475